MCAEHELVDSLDEFLVQLLALLLLLGPVMSVGLCVDAVDLLMVVDKSVDGVGGELVSHLVPKDHVDVHNVSFDVDQLMAEVLLVEILGHVGFRAFGQHDGRKSPDGVRRGQGLSQTSLVLRDTVERTLDTVDTLQGLCKPRLNFGTQDNVDGGRSWCEGGRRGR